MGKRLLAVVFCAAAIVGVGATGALAGEIKGPPYQGAPVPGGIANETNTVPGPANAHSLCAFSGLNDFDSEEGQNIKQTQTPADGPRGAPGHGFEVAPGVIVSCRGN
jgi:hypothetical protein